MEMDYNDGRGRGKFVIVAGGREVRTVVVSPPTTIATANLRKK